MVRHLEIRISMYSSRMKIWFFHLKVFMKYLKQEVYRRNVLMHLDVLVRQVVQITTLVKTMVRAVSILLTIMEISIRMICVEM